MATHLYKYISSVKPQSKETHLCKYRKADGEIDLTRRLKVYNVTKDSLC